MLSQRPPKEQVHAFICDPKVLPKPIVQTFGARNLTCRLLQKRKASRLCGAQVCVQSRWRNKWRMIGSLTSCGDCNVFTAKPPAFYASSLRGMSATTIIYGTNCTIG